MALFEPGELGKGTKEGERLDLSVIVPVFNEAPTLGELYERLRQTLDGFGKTYEVIFVDDGSTDGSAGILRDLYEKDSAVKVIRFNRNYGQHAAVFAGLERARGEIIVTLDGDLQNPPEEIPKLLAKVHEGYDVVGGRRMSRQDPLVRRILSFLISSIASRLVGVELKDYGSMLRAYRRQVVEQLLRCQETFTYIPALANAFAASVAEVPVSHQKRKAGRSKYTLLRLLRLNFDLVTGFSLLPIQLVSLIGLFTVLLGLGSGLYVGLRSLLGSSPGVFMGLLALFLFFIGLQLLAIGLLGEYIGRISMEVRRRPRYLIREVWE